MIRIDQDPHPDFKKSAVRIQNYVFQRLTCAFLHESESRGQKSLTKCKQIFGLDIRFG